MLSDPAVILKGYGNLTKQDGHQPCTMQRTKLANRGELNKMWSPKGRNVYGDGALILGGYHKRKPITGWYPVIRKGAGLRHYAIKTMTITGEKSLSGSLIKHRLVNKEENNASNDKLTVEEKLAFADGVKNLIKGVQKNWTKPLNLSHRLASSVN